jgi:hypothetical protein
MDSSTRNYPDSKVCTLTIHLVNFHPLTFFIGLRSLAALILECDRDICRFTLLVFDWNSVRKFESAEVIIDGGAKHTAVKLLTERATQYHL